MLKITKAKPTIVKLTMVRLIMELVLTLITFSKVVEPYLISI